MELKGHINRRALQAIHNCIAEHKPTINDKPLGTVWTCPTCGRMWERVDIDKGLFRAAWQSFTHHQG